MKELKILIKADDSLISRFSMLVDHSMVLSITETTEQAVTQSPDWNKFMASFRENYQKFIREDIKEILDWSDWFTTAFNRGNKLFVHLYIYEGEIPVFYGNFNAYYK